MPVCEASVNEGHFTLIITLRVIFKPEAGLRSRTIGQVLVPLVGGDPF